MSEPLILALISWAEERLTSIYTANTKAAFDEAFDAFVDEKVQVVLNGEQLTRDEYKRRLYNERQRNSSSAANVKFNNNVVAFSTPSNAVIELGSVGLFYVATLSDGVLVGAVTSSMNIKVQRKEIPIKPGQPIQDNRKVTVINQVASVVDDASPQIAHASTTEAVDIV
ncbi:hypothetical protein WOLCODRAFT_17994 [Wolfiporia cocos MD-104 SS10]|uniref:Uncharacterized protein n=1 Tax=Wolfiporia cocos (strain MD-104) TaxID=742152 RepID=A0A2H3JSJ1_WOLCO|nr:hypothetical protein WOLCODRAFT_17994 [Wolfiporia cocos MD-104 SS10]